MAQITLKNVSSAPDAVLGPVRDFSFDARDHEFVVFAGPPSSGNLTALRLIAGLEKVSQGEISIGERVVSAIPAKERDLGMVFQSPALFPHMTLYENLALGLKLRRFPKAEIKKRVEKAAALLELNELLDRKPEALDTGQLRRAAICRGIALQAKALLLEEPLAGLDPVLRTRLRAEIVKLHERLQSTMIYATADPAEAMTVAGRIVLMREGVLQQTGAPLELYTQPVNLFVAGFFGSPAMNFIRGKLRSSSGGIVFKEADVGTVELLLGQRPELLPYAGRELVVGIRPEDVEIVQGTGKPDGTRFQGVVEMIEPMGAETFFHVQTGAHTIVSRSALKIGRNDAGHRAQFEIDLHAVHFFDPATALRIKTGNGK